MKPTILVVDDEPGVRSSLSGVLRDEGYSVEAVSSGEACLERVAARDGAVAAWARTCGVAPTRTRPR